MISLDHLTLLDVPPPDLVVIARDAGFDAVGIRIATAGPGEEPYPMTVDSRMLAQTLDAVHDTGIEVLDVEVLRLGPDTTPADYRQTLEVGGRLRARFINVMGDDPDLARIADTFATLVDEARPYGLRPLIEPMVYRPVSDLDLAVRVVKDSGGGGILFDTLHFARYGGDLDRLRAVDAALLPVVQLCDAPLAAPKDLPRPRWLPRGQDTDLPDLQLESRAMRLLPGEGELPLAEILAALPAGIPIAVEAPVVSLWRNLPAADIARRARRAVSTVLDTG
jgi:sugar phosphate isomerase/epimerase